MWCKHCHQEVPGIALQGDKRFCPRCGEAVEASVTLDVPLPAVAAERPNPWRSFQALLYDRRPPPCEDWELDDTLRRIELAIRPRGLGAATTRIDSAHWEPGAPHHAVQRTGRAIQAAEEIQPRGVLPMLGWFALFAGTMAASCGGALLIWSRVASRPDLWPVGQPIALGGVCCLLVALIVQLDAALGSKSA